MNKFAAHQIGSRGRYLLRISFARHGASNEEEVGGNSGDTYRHSFTGGW